MELFAVISGTLLVIVGLHYFYLLRYLKNLNKRLSQKETNVMLQNYLCDGIENLVADGWQLNFCHSFGLCAKRPTDEFFVPIEDAIFDYMNEQIDIYDGLREPNEGGKRSETPKFQPSPNFATRVS